MADETTPPVDPRFDPVFQRGYDPAVHPAPRRSVLQTPVKRPSVAVIPPMPVAPMPVAPMPVAPAPAEPAPVAEARVAPEVEDGSARRNPWLLALPLVSAAFLVVAGLLLWGAAQGYSFSGVPDPADLMVQQLSYMLPPGLIAAGLLGLVLRLALGVVLGAGLRSDLGADRGRG